MKSHPIPQNKSSVRGAFTLIELLIVVAIIAILAAASIPLAKIVGDASKSARSIKNLGTIGVVLSAYSTENDNLMPPIESDQELDWGDAAVDLEIDGDDLESLPYWVRALILYGTESETDLTAKTFGCPGLDWRDGADKRIPIEDVILAYGATEAMYGYDDEGDLDDTYPRSVLRIENKPQTIVVVETKQDGTQPMSYGQVSWSDAKRDLGRSKPDESKTVDFRFKKSFNALMADGSTRAFSHKDRKEIEEPHWTGEDYDTIR